MTRKLSLFLGVGLIAGCSEDVSPPVSRGVIGVTAVCETVDTVGTVDEIAELALAFDQFNNPFILYVDEVAKSLKFADRIDGTWHSETIAQASADPFFGFGRSMGLTLNSAGVPYVSYRKFLGSSSELHVAHREGSVWSDTTLYNEDYIGWHSSIAIDRFDQIHLAYSSGYPNYDLWYATHVNGVWSSELVDAEGETGFGVSIELNSQDKQVIGYADNIDSGNIKVARLVDSEWVRDTIHTGYYVPEDLDFALDLDIPWVVYRCTSVESGVMTTNTLHFGDLFSVRSVVQIADFAWNPSVAFDDLHDPWLSYSDQEGHLRIVVRSSGEWRAFDMSEFLGTSILNSDMRFDADGHIGVAFDREDGLFYATLTPLTSTESVP